MITFKKPLKIIIISALLISAFLAGNNLMAASNADQALSGLKTMIKWAYGGGQEVTVNQGTFASSLIHVINLLLSFIGIIFFLLMLYAGYLWMTARGNDEQVQKAKKIIREAVTALIIILTARIITEFILITIGQATQSN